MEYTMLGRTGLRVSRTGFGCIPIQRLDEASAVALLHQAQAAGINFFDTAHTYTDSESKLGLAFSGPLRDSVVIATKTMAKQADDFWRHLEKSLQRLQTSRIDVYQFHNPGFVPQPGGADGLYDAAVEARRQGLIRFIGISSHASERAIAAVESGLFDTLQFPFSYLATERDLAVVDACARANVAFIAMKAMGGGLLTNSAAAFAYIRSFPNVVPIWGIERPSELEDFLRCAADGVELDDTLRQAIDRDREELAGQFCRGCGYCQPCPAGIVISQAARMSFLLKRSAVATWTTPEWQASMQRIENCTHCGACAKKCPYGLVPEERLARELEYYRKYLENVPPGNPERPDCRS